MTEPDIRVLLAELADAVEPPDLASAAWDRSVRRHRVRTTVGAGAVAAVVAVAAGTVYERSNEQSVRPAHQSPTTPSLPEPSGPMLKGFSLAVAPTHAEEATLPPVASPLPPVIDLSAPNPSVIDDPLPFAVAAFGIQKVIGNTTRFDGVMLIGPQGELRHLDASRLHSVQNANGESADPFTTGSLSPDGVLLAFPQPDGVALFSLTTSRWTDYTVAASSDDLLNLHWSPDGLIRIGLTTLDPHTGATTRDRIDSPLDGMYGTPLNVESWWGSERTLDDRHARAASYLDEGTPVPGVDPNPPAIVVLGDGLRALLLIPDQQPRWKGCCTVAGWLDANTVAYEATSSTNPLHPDQVSRILAWDVANGEVGLVATVTGSGDMLFRGSYADLTAR
jgi:hypothetical protein